ncbi:hypothetical protein Kisp01_50060 [Kineosporia sp. NBRC 101677]|uniref:hypothetical protein n=1 Tax=Kineosporia sp. NBRC 101677 TaxID=3032197 RepID=UPI0024A1097A|nr:hypothetical protein [Kineosporia sp. NBRC 101677]GLY17992.1 hypothetical protein Kisp01_50060 [Kineosporia sp. NBRC 101677]
MKQLLSALAILILVPVALIAGLGMAWSVDDGNLCLAGCDLPGAGSARPFAGQDGYVDDPTSSGFITLRMMHVLNEIQQHFEWPWGVACWDEHAWNPSSDHPQGRACDYTVGKLGAFPDPADQERGWLLAEWLRVSSDALWVSYVIFDGKIWSKSRHDEGWRTYDGGGVYNPEAATGGHFDHVHVSVR